LTSITADAGSGGAVGEFLINALTASNLTVVGLHAPYTALASAGRTSRSGFLVVQDNTQERIVDVDLALVVVNEARLAEFVHEKIYARPRGADHFCQRLLRHFG
jgi:hypothetical protein